MSELLHLPDEDLWTTRGILYLHQLTTNGTLKSFNMLKEEFTLPNYMMFRFLQVKHAVQTQFPISPPQPTPNVIMAIVKNTDPKKLTSPFYNILITPVATKLAYELKPHWKRAIGSIEDEEWEEAIESCKVVSPKLPDRLTQIYILHQAYLTPLRVARYRSSQSTMCQMCGKETGTFIHLLWSCPKIQGLWTQVVTFLHDNMGSPGTLDPKTCLIGILFDSIDKYTKTFMHETLFLAQKTIARKWMRPLPPRLSDWKVEINNSLPYKKFMYTNRGCPTK